MMVSSKETEVSNMAAYKEVFMRSEIKYLLEKEQYEKIRKYLDSIARVDEYGLSRINNIYFDTPDYRLIRTSMEKPVYKEKLRLRTYGETGDDTNSFIEIKKKYNGVVYKRRISGRYADNYGYLTGCGTQIEKSQIAGEIDQTLKLYQNLRPAMSVCYDRVAMVGIENPGLRITFDSHITYNDSCRDLREEKGGKPLLAEGQYLMEIKVENGFPMELAQKLSEFSIFPVSFSKYGLGYKDMIQAKAQSRRMVQSSLRAGRKEAGNTGRIQRKGVAAYV